MNIFQKVFFCLTFLLLSINLYSQREVAIKVVTTSDVHGTLFPFDYINNTAIDYGLAHAYTYIDQARQRKDQNLILLDNGDILQGQPTAYYANKIDTVNGHLIAKAMNYMGYDAATIGNHDIEVGPEIYNKLAEQFNFPWLSANILDIRTQKPYFKPYKIITRDSVRVAVLGLITPGVPKWLSPNLWKDMVFTDMIVTAKQWMDSIKINENPHIVIGLFHSGHNATYEGADPNKTLNENASLLVAQQVPGFDVVFTGHDHDVFQKNVINTNGDTVIIMGPGGRARYISDISIKLKLDRKNNITEKKISGKNIPMQGLMPNPEYVSHFSKYIRDVEEYVDRRVGFITKTISSRDAYFGPSAFVDLIHSVQMGVSNTQISFAAPLYFDANIEQGPIYVRDMFKLYSYENLLYIMRLSGLEIKNYLEYSYGLWLNTMQSENDNMLLLRKDDNGNLQRNSRNRAMLKSSFYNFDSASGIRYKVDISKPVGDRITIIAMEDGSPFDISANYNVSINSYRGTGGGGHLTEGTGLSKEEINSRIINISTMDMRYYLMKWIENNKHISPSTKDNWEIIPEKWVEIASKKDFELLFGE